MMGQQSIKENIHQVKGKKFKKLIRKESMERHDVPEKHEET